MRPRSSSGASTPSTWTTTTPVPSRQCSARARPGLRWQVRPDPRLHRDRGEVVERRRLEGSLHPHREPGRERPARRGQRVRVGQPRDGRGHTWFTCCVDAGGPQEAVQVRVRGPAGLQRRDHSPLHADTFSILKTTKRPDAAFKALTAWWPRRAADGLRRHAGGPPSSRRGSTRSTPASRTSSSTGTSPRPCSPTPTSRTTSPGSPTTRRSEAPCRPSATSTGPRPG